MSRTDWKNLPDTSTPVNAENLLNDSAKNIITASVSENYTLTTANYEILPLNISTKIGNKLQLENNQIIVGSGVSKIKISAKVSFNTLTSGLKWLTLFQNNAAVSANPMILTGRATLSTNEILVNVVEGDKFTLQINGTNDDVIRGGVAYTNITIEVVD